MRRLALYILFALLTAPALGQQRRAVRISLNEGGFTGQIAERDHFGRSIAVLGDLDGNGMPDLAVGAPDDGRVHIRGGAVWILLLNTDGTVKANQKIITGQAGFTGQIDEEDRFGITLASVGDLDSDGMPELAVGAPGDDDAGQGSGAIWILSIGSDGTVNRETKLSDNPLGIVPRDATGRMLCEARPVLGLPPVGITPCDFLGMGLAGAGDVNGDGVDDLHVLVHVSLYMGTLIQEIDDLYQTDVVYLLDEAASIVDTLTYVSMRVSGVSYLPTRNYALKCAAVGDLSGNGVGDLACGAVRQSTQAVAGRVSYEDNFSFGVRYLGRSGEVEGFRDLGGISYFSHHLRRFEDWPAISAAGDVDGDAVPDLLIGNPSFDSEGIGAVHRVFLRRDGGVEFVQTRSPIDSEDFLPDLIAGDHFGTSAVSLGDVDGNGLPEMAVGAPASQSRQRQGSVWILFNEPLPGPVIESYEVFEGPVIDRGVTIGAQTQKTLASVAEAAVHFRRGGDSTFFLVDMNPETDSSWKVTIPPLFVTDRGLEYYVTARDVRGSVSREPTSDFLSLPIRMPEGHSIQVHSGSAANGYRLVSFPLELDVSEARAVLEDDLGAYDIKRWRFFDTHPLLNELVELGEDSLSIEPGRAYWLLAIEPGLSISSGPGTTVRTDEPLSLRLRGGWNLVGNPFAFPLPLSRVTVDSVVVSEAMAFEGDWVAVDTLNPFVGYAVHLESAGTLRLHPHPVEGAVSSAKHEGADGLSWGIRITGEQGLTRDADNVAGVSAIARNGWDRADRPEPPVVGDYVSVSFPRSEWGRTATRYRYDVRSEPVEGAAWSLEVRTMTREMVDLSFEDVSTVPGAFEVWLVDETADVRQDLRAKKTYRLSGPGENQSRSVQLVVGTAEFVEGVSDLPGTASLGLSPAFPNPFDESATIPLEIDADRTVDLLIYDVLGRRVATLMEGASLSPGRHAVVWDGRSDDGTPAASGLYFARLKDGNHQSTETLLKL